MKIIFISISPGTKKDEMLGGIAGSMGEESTEQWHAMASFFGKLATRVMGHFMGQLT
jgi:hypothetical protein